MQTTTNPQMVSDEIRAKMEKYRAELLTFGMQQSARQTSSVWHWFFFIPATEHTAFVVNLTANFHCIDVVFGYSSTAFTQFAGCENELVESGISDKDITIHEKLVICNEKDEENARQKIADMYHRYRHTSKEELLSFAKEKRKEFIQQIATKLKPLGFRKKSNSWTRPLTEEYYLMFNAQKSSFSDEYYFNVYIGKNGTRNYGDCYYTRLIPMNMCPADWQSLGAENFDFFLEQTVVPALTEIIRTPLDTLGKNPSYWPKCSCDRKKCSFCWMEKNLSDLTEEKTYRLPVRTTDGMTDLEVKHTVVPLDDDNASITVSAMVQGTLHYYTSDSTEKNLLALARNLPEGWHIKSCISCRHGHFCPVGNGDNELFCITDFEPKAPCDLWSVTEDDTQRKIRSRTLFDCCDQYREQSADYFTYSDYYDTINKPKS